MALEEEEEIERLEGRAGAAGVLVLRCFESFGIFDRAGAIIASLLSIDEEDEAERADDSEFRNTPEWKRRKTRAKTEVAHVASKNTNARKKSKGKSSVNEPTPCFIDRFLEGFAIAKDFGIRSIVKRTIEPNLSQVNEKFFGSRVVVALLRLETRLERNKYNNDRKIANRKQQEAQKEIDQARTHLNFTKRYWARNGVKVISILHRSEK